MALTITLPVSKSRKSFSEATARSDRINFGGMVTESAAESGAESMAAAAREGTVGRFAFDGESADFPRVTGFAETPAGEEDSITPSFAGAVSRTVTFPGVVPGGVAIVEPGVSVAGF
jgi:hypothetical protein